MRTRGGGGKKGDIVSSAIGHTDWDMFAVLEAQRVVSGDDPMVNMRRVLCAF